MKTREARHEELRRLAAGPNGLNRLYAIVTGSFIAFDKLPLATLLIEAILEHEYPREACAAERCRAGSEPH